MANFNMCDFELFDDVLFNSTDDSPFDVDVMMLGNAEAKLDFVDAGAVSDSTDPDSETPGSPQNVMDGPSSPIVLALEGRNESLPNLRLAKPASTIGRKRKLSGEQEDVKKQRLQARRLRKNSREKQRRQEVNILFEALVDLLGLPAESKSDKVTILATGINTIKTLRAHSSQDGLKKAEMLVSSLTKERAMTSTCPTMDLNTFTLKTELMPAVPVAMPMTWF